MTGDPAATTQNSAQALIADVGGTNTRMALVDAAGNQWVVSLGWNNPDAMVDDDRMIHIALGIFALLAEGELPTASVTDEATASP
mgnify:CR=1 FL=1